MSIFDVLLGLLSLSFYRLWYPVISAHGFSSPVTLAIIAAHNTFSMSYLLLVTAVGCLAWHRRGWTLPFAIALLWTAIGLVFFGAYSPKYGVAASFAALFTHGWLELSALFYWIHSLRRASLKCRLSQDNEWASWKVLLKSLRAPKRFLVISSGDLRKAWNQTGIIAKGLWRQNLKQSLTTVLFMIFVSAIIETYVTPVLALALMI